MLKLNRKIIQPYTLYTPFSGVHMASLVITTKDPGLSGDMGVAILTITILGIALTIIGSRIYRRKKYRNAFRVSGDKKW